VVDEFVVELLFFLVKRQFVLFIGWGLLVVDFSHVVNFFTRSRRCWKLFNVNLKISFKIETYASMQEAYLQNLRCPGSC
jgi:hypothetical protein